MPMPLVPSYRPDEDRGADHLLLQEYEHFLAGKAEGTIDAYLRTVRQVMAWVARVLAMAGTFIRSS